MKVTVLRSDPRLAYAARALTDLGYSVMLADPEERLDAADILLLPIPVSRDGVHISLPERPTSAVPLAEVIDRAPGRIFGGGFSAGAVAVARRGGREVTDLLAIPAFVYENAVLTAEAALGVGMRAAGYSLRALPVGVVGYGRIAAALTRRLVLLGAHVSVFARRPESRLAARGDGAEAYDLPALLTHLGGIRLLYNTVPAGLLTDTVLANLSDCAIVELASGKNNIGTPPGGRGVTVTPAPGLPGKIFPKSAGIIIAHTLDQTMQKEGT